MRSTNRVLFLLFTAVVIVSCQNKSTSEDENPYDTTSRKANEHEILTAREREFVDDAIEDNNEELAWLNAAVKKDGIDAELKTHAQHMLTDHEKMNTDLKALAAKKNVEVEEVDTSVIIMDINEDNAADWDAEWADEMADKHRKLIRRFERAAHFVNDAELKGLVNESLPKLRAHLDMATKLEERLDKKN